MRSVALAAARTCRLIVDEIVGASDNLGSARNPRQRGGDAGGVEGAEMRPARKSRRWRGVWGETSLPSRFVAKTAARPKLKNGTNHS